MASKKDFLRESMSYFGLLKKVFQVKKTITPESVSFGDHKDQYFLYYGPNKTVSDKIIIWVHGGGWNAGMFLETGKNNKGLDKFFSWIEEL